jgi:integrase
VFCYARGVGERTFAGLLDQWLELHTLGRKPRAVEFNEEIAGIVRSNWPGYLNAPAAAISTEQVTTFAQRVTHYCPSRWNAMLSALRFITPHAFSLRKRPLHSKERPPISPDQFARLIQELKARPRSHAALVIRFLAHTGLRIDEARKLRWEHVRDDFIFVPRDSTKNSKAKFVPFIPGMRELLAALRVVSDVSGRGGFVLPQGECKTALNRACRVLGLPHLSHHDFRHIFTTRCLESGVDVPTVARWRGDSDGGAMLLKRYFHLIDEHSRRMAAKVVV